MSVPWPASLLKCYQHTDEMQPGDEMIISLKDKDVKESLVLILNAMPEHTFDVSTAGHCYLIHVIKNENLISGKDRGIPGGS